MTNYYRNMYYSEGTEKVCRELDKAFDDFLSLFSRDYSEKLRNHLYFAGGCIYSLCNGSEPKDYDLFCDSPSLLEELKQLDWGYKTEFSLTRGKFQVVTKYNGIPRDCAGEFDFKHNCYYYRPYTGFICFALKDDPQLFQIDNYSSEPGMYNYLYTDRLYFNENRARDVDRVYFRLNKFLQRGMKISKEEKQKLLNKVDLQKIKKMEEDFNSNKVPVFQRGDS